MDGGSQNTQGREVDGDERLAPTQGLGVAESGESGAQPSLVRISDVPERGAPEQCVLSLPQNGEGEAVHLVGRYTVEEVATEKGFKVCTALLLHDFDVQGGPYISRAHSLLRVRAGQDGHYILEVKDCKAMGAATTRIYSANQGGERRVSPVGYIKVEHGDIIHFAPRVLRQGSEMNYDTMRYRVVFPGLRPPGARAIKFLVPEREAGFLFGKAGSNIKEAGNVAGATIHASLRGHFFPNTQERVFAVSASGVEELCHATE